MPTIPEEMDEDVDFSQPVSLPDAAFPVSSDVSLANNPTSTPASLQPGPEWCPDHLETTNCYCVGFLDDWDVPATTTTTTTIEDGTAGVAEPDYSRFENWIPQFVRPDKPCDYCRSRRLQCYKQRGEPFCTSCATLFRQCSLAKSSTSPANNYIDMHNGTFLDTLHVVDEDACKEQGTLTGIKTLRSTISTSGSTTPVRSDDAPGSSKRNGIRFPRQAVKTLRDWLDAHTDNPYPTEEEKVELEKVTELKPSQIANWLANARRRRKATEKSRPKVAESPTLRPTTNAIPIARADKPWDELNPFERWKHSPPENEPALMSDIATAVANNQVPDGETSASPSTLGRSSKRRKGSSDGSSLSHRRAPSTTSLETRQTSSVSSSSAAYSKVSSASTHGSFGSFSSSLAGKKDRRRRRRPAPAAAAATRKPSDDKRRIFQCTFCTDTFKSKYDWTRHEKSLHLSLEKWICAPLGPIITDLESGNKQCVYCDLHNPSSDHIESHNHRQCEDKGLDARTFYRKDHLRQHLRLIHGCEMAPKMDSWKSTAININSRCGFCSQRFSVWQERVDHLTAHFKTGARMSEWKGCRGLDPAVAAQVTNAMPPYLIGIEAVSPNPFSASNRASWRQASELGETANTPSLEAQEGTMCAGGSSTCWEVLTVRLGRYAKAMADQGVVMTDEMLQRQARQILYDSDDPWNQTAADNPEWLDLFKKAHGLNFIPSELGGQGAHVPEDLETYGDLGLRIPFAVQLQAYNQVQSGNHANDAGTRPGPYQDQQARSSLLEVYDLLSQECAFYDGEQRCSHSTCRDNVLNLGAGANGPAKRWCTQEISPAAAHKLLTVMGIGTGVQSLSSPQGGRPHAHQALDNIDSQCHPHIGSCTNQCDQRATAGSRVQVMDGPTRRECVPDPRSAARAQGLSALSRAEAGEVDDFADLRSARGYLPRHKYRLSKDQARLFATTTGAWEDCGIMPAPVHTSLPEFAERTSTGAMMEFLGGNIGSNLSFANDNLTSEIPISDGAENGDWQLPDGGTVSQEEMMNQLNELVNAMTSAEDSGFNPGLTAMDLDWTTSEFDPVMPASPAVDEREEMNFDDLTFDSVFDMPPDGTFA